jgi:hypothetical protein
MRTLLGVYKAGERGRTAAEILRHRGFEVQIIGDAGRASDIARDRSDDTTETPRATAASSAVVAGLASGGIGALPGALLGGVVGGWLNEQRARQYEQEINNGGVLLVVKAPELAPAAQAEKMLYESGADHVESGETPLP